MYIYIYIYILPTFLQDTAWWPGAGRSLGLGGDGDGVRKHGGLTPQRDMHDKYYYYY